MQTFRHPIESSYNKEERAHYIRGFLISTKPTARTQTDPISGFSVSKETGHEKVKTFLGKSFAIIPESLSDVEPKGDGHFYAHTRNELVQGYDKHAHGKIKGLYGPFFYNDKSGDYWYDFNIKLFNSQSAAALIQHGQKMWIPFAVSPHIVRQEQSPHNSKDWEGVGVALVRRGAYGNNAVISKLCEGTDSQCSHSMAGAVMSPQEFEKWQSTYPPVVQLESTGEKTEFGRDIVRVTNLDEVATPLNSDQLSDLNNGVRVELEHRMQEGINSGTRLINVINQDPVTGQMLAEPKMQVESFGTREGVLEPRIGQEDSPKGFFPIGTSGLNQYLTAADRGATIDSFETLAEKPLHDIMDISFTYSSQMELDYESTRELRIAVNERDEQVQFAVDSQINAINQDIASGELHLSEDLQLVHSSMGDQRLTDLQAAGEYGQPNNGIRGVTGQSRFLPVGTELPPLAGGAGECCIFNQYGGGGCGPCNRGSAGAFVRQTAEPLNSNQLSDMHAAMRVKTEDIMEGEISNFIYRAPPSDNPIERFQHMEATGQDFVTRSPSSQAYALKSITGPDTKPYLQDILVNAQQGGLPSREFNEDTGVETIVRDPPLVDQYKAIVNKNLNDQFNAVDLDKPNAWEQQNAIRTAMDTRDAQVDNEYGSVINEIKDDINSEKIDLDTDGQLISERFGWRSASEAMSQGDYGQTNGGIRGVTDAKIGSGECCIFNQYGGGGCGPCGGSAGATVSYKPLNSDQLDHLHASIRVTMEDKMEASISTSLFRETTKNFSDIENKGQFFVTREAGNELFYRQLSPAESQVRLQEFEQNQQGRMSAALWESIGRERVYEPTSDSEMRQFVGYTSIQESYQRIVSSDLLALNRNEKRIQVYAFEHGDKEMQQESLVRQNEILEAVDVRNEQVHQEFTSVFEEIGNDIDSGAMHLQEDGQLVSDRFGGISASEAMANGDYGQTNGGIRGITDSTLKVDVGGGVQEGECCIFNQYGGGGCGPCH